MVSVQDIQHNETYKRISTMSSWRINLGKIYLYVMLDAKRDAKLVKYFIVLNKSII